MNNRQAALIAASNQTDQPHIAAHRARLLEVWLNELDAAEADGRVPADFETVSRAVQAAPNVESAQESPVVNFSFVGDRPSVELANGRKYDWHGSWSRVS